MYELAAATILDKMPLTNPLLKALTALDPSVRVTLTLDELLKLPHLVTNVLTVEEQQEYDLQVRCYVIANNLPPYHAERDRIDEWWHAVNSKNEYSSLCKLVFALISCFHGPAFESSFNVMEDIIDVKLAYSSRHTHHTKPSSIN